MKNAYLLVPLIMFLFVASSACRKDPVEAPPQQTNPPGNQPPNVPTNSLHFATLSIPRSNVVAAATSTKLLIAGGMKRNENWPSPALTIVDVYDKTNQIWTTANLSKPRYNLCAIAHQENVFFAGGLEDDYTKASSRVDIYNATANTWSTAELSEARTGIIATAAGNKVVFTGGYYYDANENLVFSRRVDIYDIVSNTWSTATLSIPRINHTASAVGNKIYIAGGERPDPNPAVEVFGLNPSVEMFSVNQSIDVYDVATNSWSISSLQNPRTGHSAVVVDEKIYFIGGWSEDMSFPASKGIEILNIPTQTFTFQSVPENFSPVYKPIYFQKLILVIVAGPMQNITFILDVATGTWKEQIFSSHEEVSAHAILDNTLYTTNGISVWKQTF